MRRALLLARRELGALLTSSFGWVIVALVLMIDGVLFNALAMAGEKPTSEVLWHFFYYSAGVVMVASIFVAMRTFAAEREQGTLVLLTTSPLVEWELVLGKFLGAFAFVLLLCAGTLYMPILVDVHGSVPWGHVAAGYLGLTLLAAATTAIGVFASSISRYQILAVVLGGVIMVGLLTTWQLAKVTDPPLKSVLGYLALFDKHYKPFMAGGVHLHSLVFFPTLSFLFLLASVRVLEARRWR